MASKGEFKEPVFVYFVAGHSAKLWSKEKEVYMTVSSFQQR